MRHLALASSLLLFSPDAASQATPPLRVTLECASPKGPLAWPAGGPDGAQWNVDHFRCTATTRPPSGHATIDHVRIDAWFGQPGGLELVARAYSSSGDLSHADIVVPAATFDRLTPTATISQPSGATVFLARIHAPVVAFDADGRIVARGQADVGGAFAFGE